MDLFFLIIQACNFCRVKCAKFAMEYLSGALKVKFLAGFMCRKKFCIGYQIPVLVSA